jgi:hypothetical protein
MERNENASFAIFLLGFCWMLPRKAGIRLERREDDRQGEGWQEDRKARKKEGRKQGGRKKGDKEEEW